jgi:hypothetical protein
MGNQSSNIHIARAFSFLKIQRPTFINDSSPSVVMQTAIGIWYLSWVFGLGMDLNMQERVYFFDPDEGHLPREMYFTFGIMLLFAIIMMYFVDEPKYFVLILTVFSIVSIFGYLLYARRASKIIDSSYTEFVEHRDRVRIEQINCLRNYIQGRWNRVRAVVLVAMLIPIDILCWDRELRSYLVKLIVGINGAISPSALDTLLPTLLVIFFLALAEGWQWIRRLEAKFTISVLRKLEGKLI